MTAGVLQLVLPLIQRNTLKVLGKVNGIRYSQVFPLFVCDFVSVIARFPLCEIPL